MWSAIESSISQYGHEAVDLVLRDRDDGRSGVGNRSPGRSPGRPARPNPRSGVIPPQPASSAAIRKTEIVPSRRGSGSASRPAHDQRGSGARNWTIRAASSSGTSIPIMCATSGQITARAFGVRSSRWRRSSPTSETSSSPATREDRAAQLGETLVRPAGQGGSGGLCHDQARSRSRPSPARARGSRQAPDRPAGPGRRPRHGCRYRRPPLGSGGSAESIRVHLARKALVLRCVRPPSKPPSPAATPTIATTRSGALDRRVERDRATQRVADQRRPLDARRVEYCEDVGRLRELDASVVVRPNAAHVEADDAVAGVRRVAAPRRPRLRRSAIPAWSRTIGRRIRVAIIEHVQPRTRDLDARSSPSITRPPSPAGRAGNRAGRRGRPDRDRGARTARSARRA